MLPKIDRKQIVSTLLVLGLIAIAVIGVLTLLGGQVEPVFSDISGPCFDS